MQAPTPSEDPGALKRLDPAAVGVWIAETVGRFAVPIIAVLLLGGESLRIFYIILAIGIGASVVRYFRFGYRLEQNALVVEGGVLGTWRRVIPYARIQSVDVVEKLRHRVFGVVELRIEAAGGRETEAALVALKPEEAARIRTQLLAHTGAPPRPDVVVPPLVKLHPRLLLLAGVTGGRVAVLAVLLGYGLDAVSEETAFRLLSRLGSAGIGRIVLIGAAFVAVAVAISIVATLLVYWDFTITREGERLTITRGLVEKRRAVVPLGRLQAIRMEENLLRWLLGLASLRAVSAGRPRQAQDEQETSLLLPVGNRRIAVALIGSLLGAPAEELLAGLVRPPMRALVPRVLGGVVVGTALGVLSIVAYGRAGSVAFAAIPIAVALAIVSWRTLGTTFDAGIAVVRSGVFVRRTLVMPVGNLQHLSFTVSPQQRPLGLATLRLSIPRAVGRALHLPNAVAARRFSELEKSFRRSVA
ncbi:MAG TPA: PH domain-containing protein [Actinomycetota bacterium]|nr:PH domain-containing protein [Actinomycetota bacterium]